jgi:hypothetical protein
MIPDYDATLVWVSVIVGGIAYLAWRIDCYCEENGYILPGYEPDPIAFLPDPQKVVEANQEKGSESEDGKL